MRKKALCLLLISTLLLASGCVPYHQLGERLIIQAMGLDYENDMFILTAKYFGGENPDGKKGSPKESMFITEGRGSSVSHALQEAGVNAGKPLILTDCQVLILGSGLRNRPLSELLNILVNEYEGYPDITLASTDGTAAELILLEYEDESYSTNKYNQILTESRMLGFTPDSDLYTVIRNLSNGTKCAFLPVLSVVDANSSLSEGGNYAIVNGGAIYKNDMYDDNVDIATAAGVAFLKNAEISTSVTIVYKGRPTLINVNNIHIKLKPELQDDNKLRLRIVYNVSASYSEARINFETDEIEKAIEEAIDERIEEGLNKTVTQLGVDVIGLEETIRNKLYSEWKRIKHSFGDEIKKMDFVIDGSVRINKYGIRW